MTRQHFETIAKIIREETTTNARGRQSLALRFADMLADTNPAFDRSRFLKACGAAEKVDA
jgi:hypothetical protein